MYDLIGRPSPVSGIGKLRTLAAVPETKGRRADVLLVKRETFGLDKGEQFPRQQQRNGT